MTTSHKIAVVDPSLFTLPYDAHLCSGLAEATGHSVTLYGRNLRRGEVCDAPNFEIRNWYYPYSEPVRGRHAISRFARQPLKLLEHALGNLKLIKLFRNSRPEVVHFQWLPVPALDQFAIRQLKRKQIPVVLTVHDTTPFNAAPTSRVQNLAWHKTLQGFDHLIVHTEASRNKLLELGITVPIAVIPHGILTFGEAREPENRGKLNILFFGAIKPYKGLDILLRAFARVEQKEGAQLRIIGNCGLRGQEFVSMITELGLRESVVFENRFFDDNEIPSMMAGADLVVFPYRRIDASGAFLTAIGYGKAFLATNLPTFREFVGNRSFALVQPDSVDELSSRLHELILAPAKLDLLRNYSCQIRAEIPTWHDIGMRTNDVYKEVSRTVQKAVAGPQIK